MESVLGRTIQIEAILLNRSNAVENGGGEGSVVIDTAHQIIKSVDLGEQEHLGVGGPQHDDLVDALFHVANVLSQSVNLLTVRSSDDIVSTVALVCGDVLWVEGGGEGRDGLELWAELVEKGRLEDACSQGSFVQVVAADIPSADLEVDGVNSGEQVLNVTVNITQVTSLLIKLEADVSSGALSE